MQLHDLKIKEASKIKPKKRIGRGGKRGTFSGRGTKGQKARSGHKILPAERVLIQRLPKMRGMKNNPKSHKTFALNVGQIEKMGLTIIDRKTLLKKNLMGLTFKGKIKVLGSGEINTPVEISKNVLVSKSAEAKIVKAKGKVNKR